MTKIIKSPTKGKEKPTPPTIHPVAHLSIPAWRTQTLDNGIPLYVLQSGEQDILKIEIVFKAGRPQENMPLVARATSQMLREGTLHRSGAAMAELLDFYAGSLVIPTNFDYTSTILYLLKKHEAHLLPLFAEVVQSPLFAQHELAIFKENGINELKVDLDKPEVVAYRVLTEAIFGADHPYGYNSSEEAYRQLDMEAIKKHYQDYYTPHNCIIFLSGKPDENTIASINRLFGAWKAGAPPKQIPIPTTYHAPKHITIPSKNSSQTALILGRKLFNKSHPDYNGFFVLNTIIGGYFGSRLMMNIREKKGLTYNIYSTMDTLSADGYFYIASEVKKGSTKATLKEIHRELMKLQTTPLDDTELLMVKNYLLGMLLHSIDGPMNTSELIKTLVVEQLPSSYFDSLVHDIRHITATQLQQLAAKWLKAEDFWQVVVG